MSGASEECGSPPSGLAHVRLNTMTVETAGGSFTVRALSQEDLLAIYSANSLLLAGILDGVEVDDFGLIKVSDPAGQSAKLESITPTLMCHIIARAADEPDVALADRLPQGVQTDALDKIAALSFPNDANRSRLLGSVLAFERSSLLSGERVYAAKGSPLN